MFQITICDEDTFYCEHLRKCLEEMSKKQKIECSILVCHKGSELKDYLMRGNRVDLLFLEIELTESNGVNLGKYIREVLLDFQTQIVYISHEQEYAMQLFETEPMDFLLKPLEKVKIEKVFQRFLKQQISTERLFTYKAEHGKARIPYSSICYFQSMGHKVIIHTIEGEREFYGKLADIENRVPGYFVRIHKSYLVNEHFISSFHYDRVVLQNEQKLTISKSYRSAIQKRISQQAEKM